VNTTASVVREVKAINAVAGPGREALYTGLGLAFAAHAYAFVTDTVYADGGAVGEVASMAFAEDSGSLPSGAPNAGSEPALSDDALATCSRALDSDADVAGRTEDRR
jgi:hypothetical protein